MKNTIKRMPEDTNIIINDFKFKAIGYNFKNNKQEYDIMINNSIKIRNDINCSDKAHKLIETLNNNTNSPIYNECIDEYIKIVINKANITTLYELYEHLNKYLDLSDNVVVLSSSVESLVKKVQSGSISREEALFLTNSLRTKNSLTVVKNKIMHYKEVIYTSDDNSYYCITSGDQSNSIYPGTLIIKKLQVTKVSDNVDTMEKANELIKKIIK